MTEELLEWLGYDGVAFFTMVEEEYKTLNAVWIEGKEGRAPHSVHFREGMVVRNKMRDIQSKNNIVFKNAHYYDDNWEKEVLKCLKLCKEREDKRIKETFTNNDIKSLGES